MQKTPVQPPQNLSVSANHNGEPIPPKIFVIEYDKSSATETELENVEKCIDLTNNQCTTFLAITGDPTEEMIDRIEEIFNLNPLTSEDVLNKKHYSKIEIFEDYVLIILKHYRYSNPNLSLNQDKLTVIFSKNYVITFFSKEDYLYKLIAERLKKPSSTLRAQGTDFLTYTIVDSIVDSHFEVLKFLSNKTEKMENALINDPSPKTLKSIYQIKKETMILRQGLWPLRDIASAFQQLDEPFVHRYMDSYIRDLYDHAFQLIETLEIIRESVSHMFDIYLSSTSNKLNETMKMLTLIATVFIPLTFIAGVYGMNFEYMPELKWKYGYVFVWTVMITIAGSMVVYFRKKKWI